MKHYAERLRALREDHDCTQQEIAVLLQTMQQVYPRYEKGVNEIPVRHIATLEVG
ncbi:MAG: helix-turn-helix transcriptional regulator [Ruminococcaceae bacterium]|nr:helix-turn-helix transcriptional regulator [Oscillospiraceae bacterium]